MWNLHRLTFGVAAASLALNALTVGMLIRLGRVGIALRTEPADAAQAAVAAPMAAFGQPDPLPFRRNYSVRNKATGILAGVIIPDDTSRLETFIAMGELSPDQAAGVRARYLERQKKETALAEEMVQRGAWESGRFYDLMRAFWDHEFQRLPPQQAIKLPPAFVPAHKTDP